MNATLNFEEILKKTVEDAMTRYIQEKAPKIVADFTQDVLKEGARAIAETVQSISVSSVFRQDALEPTVVLTVIQKPGSRK